jgi:predicted nucleic acid-binding protein
MIVSNTSPLYYLHQLGCLEVFRDLFGRVHTTPQVLAELEAGKVQGLNIPNLSALGWFVIQDIAVPSFLELIADLGKGEASVLALALEHAGSFIIVDDRLGREVAKAQNIRVTGTLGVLLLAKQSGLVASVGTMISQLHKHGFYCRRSVVTEILSLAGETGATF